MSAANERLGEGDGVFVGLDLGTSSLKGVALDAGGHAVASERERVRDGAARCPAAPSRTPRLDGGGEGRASSRLAASVRPTAGGRSASRG